MATRRKKTVKKAVRKIPWIRRTLLAFSLGAALFSGGLTLLEKMPAKIPGGHRLRATAHTFRDWLLRDSERTITIHSPEEALRSPYDNLKLGVPGMTDTVLDRPGYALGYSEWAEQPRWVAYTITADEVRNKKSSRTDDFRSDPYIPTGSADLADYAASGYDRGHLAPAADMAWSKRAMSESFYFSNMSPQSPEFNRGIWMRLESKVRDWAVDFGAVHVVTGPIFAAESITVGPHKVVVPDAYYKVLYAPSAKPPQMIGFVLANKAGDRSLNEYAVTVRRVEELTGLQFFTTVDAPLRNEMENVVDLKAWKWTPNR